MWENLRKVAAKAHGLGSYLGGTGIRSEWPVSVVSEGAGRSLGAWQTGGTRARGAARWDPHRASRAAGSGQRAGPQEAGGEKGDAPLGGPCK